MLKGLCNWNPELTEISVAGGDERGEGSVEERSHLQGSATESSTLSNEITM